MGERKPPEIEIADEERTQSIPFTDVFTRELTDTGSFDVRSEIWKTTFGKVIQALPIPALLVDGSFHVAVMNQAWMRITEHYGKSLSQPFTALFPGSSNAEKAQAILDEVFSTRKARVMECPLEIQGCTVWGRMTLRCVRVMAERLVLVLVEDLTLEKELLRETKKHQEELEQHVRERTEELLAANEQLRREVSQRKKAEEEAKASERRFKELAELLPQFVFEIDTSGKFTFVNRSGLEASGYTLEDFDKGLDASEMVAPQNRNVVAGGMERILRGEKLASFELSVQRKDGSTFPVVAFGTPIIRDERIDGMRGVAIDITDRKRAEDALVQSEERYRTLFEQSRDAIAIVREDGEFVDVNHSFSELFGYDKEEIIKLNAKELWSDPTERSKWQEVVDSQGSCRDYSCRVRIKNGTLKDVLLTSTVIETEHGDMLYQSICRDVTEQKRAEEALRESENTYRAIFENTGTATVIIDADTTIALANSEYERLAGYSKEEVEGKKSWTETVVEEDLERMKEQHRLRRSDPDASQRHYEFRLVDKTGAIKDIFLTIGMIPGTKRSVASLLDITDRKRAEAALKESEAKYRELFENASDIIYTHDLEGKFISVNQAVTRILGYTGEEFLNLNFRDIVDQEFSSVTEEQIEKKTLGKAVTAGPYELLVHSKDGTPVWVEVTSRLLQQEGIPVGVHGTARDIADRKKALEALEESEEKYRLVVENAGEAIMVAQDGKLKFVNPQAVALLGYSEADLKSSPFSEFIQPEDRELVVKRHEQRLKGESPPRVYPFRLVDKWGNPKWVEINAVLIAWEGRPATLNFLVDITAKRRIEDEMAKVEKLESLGLLAGGLAHDFNNYLTAILGNISLARIYSQSPEKASKRLEEAERACSHAQGLTQQLLTFSKGGAPVRQVEDIGELVKNSCTFALRGSNATCNFLIPQDLWPVEVDKGQIGQVLNNLIINADQAMPVGGVIRVEADNFTVKEEDELPIHEGRYVKLVIKDQGVGIAEKILPRIFEPYFTTKHKGSGLGLATSYSIVKNHEGLITVESEVGTGTTFHIYLPASEKGSRGVPVSEGPVPKGTGRVLLMDDDESIRDLGREMLTSLGYAVELARNGAEAIEAYQTAQDHSNPFDVVILDLTVPGDMGGSETIGQLRTIDPDVRAIVSSGYSNDPVLADYEEYGFCDVVSKPYTIRELGDALRRVLAQNT